MLKEKCIINIEISTYPASKTTHQDGRTSKLFMP